MQRLGRWMSCGCGVGRLHLRHGGALLHQRRGESLRSTKAAFAQRPLELLHPVDLPDEMAGIGRDGRGGEGGGIHWMRDERRQILQYHRGLVLVGTGRAGGSSRVRRGERRRVRWSSRVNASGRPDRVGGGRRGEAAHVLTGGCWGWRLESLSFSFTSSAFPPAAESCQGREVDDLLRESLLS